MPRGLVDRASLRQCAFCWPSTVAKGRLHTAASPWPGAWSSLSCHGAGYKLPKMAAARSHGVRQAVAIRSALLQEARSIVPVV